MNKIKECPTARILRHSQTPGPHSTAPGRAFFGAVSESSQSGHRAVPMVAIDDLIQAEEAAYGTFKKLLGYYL